jgi:uncharacterized phage protein (TIGR01671 family)
MIPKFRVWILNTKEMEEVVSIDMNSDAITCEIEYAYGLLFITGRKPDGVLMQSTGLKDLNGVEIYEGDILLSTASENQEDWKKWRVHYADGRFLIDYKDIPKDKRKRTNLEIEDLCEDNIWLYGLKVIGNIYENHNLIEGTEEVK